MDFSTMHARWFPELSPTHIAAMEAAMEAYRDWNQKINVISRKDMDNLGIRHFIHSLSIAKAHRFLPGKRVIDVGTGGGFPGIPLAILHPETEFLLVDAIGKKLKVVEAVSEAAGLKNVTTLHSRIEDVKVSATYITGRAVEPAMSFYKRVSGRLLPRKGQEDKSAGVYYLTGPGSLTQTFSWRHAPQEWCLADWFKEEPWFETKHLVFLPTQKGQ
jgi:16S rRNA (guanine527-N7)-methyltransferase